jgi:hypothetical protein
VHPLQDPIAAQSRRLLRVLLVRLCGLPSYSGTARLLSVMCPLPERVRLGGTLEAAK